MNWRIALGCLAILLASCTASRERASTKSPPAAVPKLPQDPAPSPVDTARTTAPPAAGTAPTSTNGTSSRAESPGAASPAPLAEVFPHVRVDARAKVVEFDAEVPAYAYATPDGDVYLEVLVCSRDTREHEALLVTEARGSDIHAALLMIGLQPGSPGAWKWKDDKILPIAPKGDAIRVEFSYGKDGASAVDQAGQWVRNLTTGKSLTDSILSGEGFLFAGSTFVKRGDVERYAADGDGTIVGLATFGSELVAWKRVFSPESEVDAPVWAVDRKRQPPAGSHVVVRLTPAAQP